MESNDTTKMSRFDVATYEEMVQRGGFIPIVLKPKFSATGNDLDGSDGGYNYIVPLEAVPAHRTELPLSGNGSPQSPYTLDRDALRAVVEEVAAGKQDALTFAYDTKGNIISIDEHGLAGTAVVAPMVDVSVNMIHAWEADGHTVYLYRTTGTGGRFRDYYVAYAGNKGTADAYKIEFTPYVTDAGSSSNWAPQVQFRGYHNRGLDNGDSTTWEAQPSIDTGDLVMGFQWDGEPTAAMISELLTNMKSRLFTNCGIRIRWRAQVADSLGWTGNRDYYLSTNSKSAPDYDTATVQRFVCVEGDTIHLLDLKGDGTYEASDVPIGSGSALTGQAPIVIVNDVITNNAENPIVEGEHAWSEGIGRYEDGDAQVVSDATESYTIEIDYPESFEPESYVTVGEVKCYIQAIDDTNSRLLLDRPVTVHEGDLVFVLGAAQGDGSHSEGWNTLAGDDGAHSEGSHTIAQNKNDHSEGLCCKSDGSGSHSEGIGTWSDGRGSHSEGDGYWRYETVTADATGTTISIYGVTDDGVMTHILVGCRCYCTCLGTRYANIVEVDRANKTITLDTAVTVSEGDYIRIYYGAYAAASHAEGENTVVGTDATGAHAEGRFTAALGAGCHAGGETTEVSGDYAFGHGTGIKMSTDNGAAFGKYNSDDGSLFEVGDGSDDGHRSDAFKVDSNGDLWYKHGGTLTKLDSVIGNVETLLSEL